MNKKRWLALVGTLLYVGFKVYVSFTANPNDDELPDRVKDIVLRLAFINPTEGVENDPLS